MTVSTGAARMTVPLTRPWIGPTEESNVVRALRSGWLAQGPMVAEFERGVAGFVGAGHGIATSNCTTALHLALVLAGVCPGDEVIVPSFTFIATANAVRHAGATPVFADIEPETLNLAPEAAEAAVTSRTRAILPVHQVGLAADVDRLSEVARRHGLLLIEDAAPAIGARYKGRYVGGLGHLACFSFHPRKVLTTGEGGMIVTGDDAIAERGRRLRAHGMSVSDLARHRASRVLIEEYDEIGFNYRLSDLHAAVGLAQLEKLPEMLARRAALAARYNAALGHLPYVRLPFSSADTPHTYQSYLIQLLPGAPRGRDEVMAELLQVGVATRRGVMACHLEPAYRSASAPVPRLPVSEAAVRHTILLPIYAEMTELEQEYVMEHLLRILLEP